MPMQQARDVFELSIEVKYVKYGGTRGQLNQDQARAELKTNLEGLLNAVEEANKKPDMKVPVLVSIESKLASIVEVIEKTPEEVFRGKEAQKLKEDAKEGKDHVRSCMLEPESCCCCCCCSCFKEPRPQLSTEKLQGLDDSLGRFIKIVSMVQARHKRIENVPATVDDREPGSTSDKGEASTHRASPAQAPGESGDSRLPQPPEQQIHSSVSRQVVNQSNAMPLASHAHAEVRDTQEQDESPNPSENNGLTENL